MQRKILLFMLVLSLAALFGCGAKEEAKTVSQQPKQEQMAGPQEAALPVEEVSAPQIGEKPAFKVFPVYSDRSSPDNHFIPSGWMGDYMDIKLEDAFGENPHSGATCIKVTYNNKATGGAHWTGIYWQYPANNWGGVDRSYNLSGAKKLTFWVRGEKGGEVIQEVKMGGISGEFPDSDTAGIGPVTLTAEWKQYEIDLSGKDLARIIGGFCWATNIDVNPEGLVFYLDDIKYE